MSRQDISLNDRFDLTKPQVLLTGTQALVRLMLMQGWRDCAAGHRTAGYVTGYRGSPLGAVDHQMTAAKDLLHDANITFNPGLNEDLAATALWGSQQAELRGEGRYDGVFGLWYGKGPGVDRSGDVMRHANMAGSAPLGGVVMVMGDDHTGESSTVLHQSDWAMVDAYMPVLSPAGVQEVLDYGAYGFALSRYSGLWVGLKAMKDTIEVTQVVDGRPDRMQIVTPDLPLPEGGLNIRLQDTPVAQEARMIDHKRSAAEAFARANRIDRRVWGAPGARIGLVSAGKNWLDLVHALALLGYDADSAAAAGLTTYKIGQTFPLDMQSFAEWAEGLDLIVVVEEKRKLLEVQIKEALFDDLRGRRVYGWHKGQQRHDGRPIELFPTRYALDPVQIAETLAEILIEEGCDTTALQGARTRLHDSHRAENAPDLAQRVPYFCSGCPHNTSTKLPEGARAYAGIGCHYMAQWMDRSTLGFTHMGGEGANWIGEAPFSTRAHVFQNLGDGTYNHSGLQAIRAAVAAGTRITYKILFNDAVAMTGGQRNEGGLDAARIARELLAFGVDPVVVVHDPKETPDRRAFPAGLRFAPRDDLMAVQQDLAAVPGVSALIYVQTCAAEKRRRRKRGTFPDPDRRLYINPEVCEGCGDCGVQSNCVSLVPLDTPLGRKRAIDQSSCNKDFSCQNGFCPSFVTIEGGRPRAAPDPTTRAPAGPDLSALPPPTLPAISGTWNLVVTGVGGTGVVTIGAVLAMAAHLDGKAAAMMEMAGLAQKGGAVHIHCRIAQRPEDISAIRVAVGEADALLGGDLVVSAAARTLALLAPGRCGAVVNRHETVTGTFTRSPDFRLPGPEMQLALEARLGPRARVFDATALAAAVLGDSLFANMLVLGAAWQQGLVPITLAAIEQAIRLNGTAPEANLRAFATGRWAMLVPEAAERLAAGPLPPPSVLATQANTHPTGNDPIELRRAHLLAYQNQALVARFDALVARAESPDLRLALARGYHKLLTYKDEYEVARLHLATRAQVAARFEGKLRLSYHLAPPLLGGTDSRGRPRKRRFGPWVTGLFWLLARMKGLRGTPFDPFAHSRDRRMERALIDQFEADMELVLSDQRPGLQETAQALAELPLKIRGFGPIKEESQARADAERRQLIDTFRGGMTPTPEALAAL